VLFYLFDLIHPTLRDITLFHETLNKDRQPYVVTIGEEISPASLPASSEEGSRCCAARPSRSAAATTRP
jgi:putative hemolysin